jgi:hypothetical protein
MRRILLLILICFCLGLAGCQRINLISKPTVINSDPITLKDILNGTHLLAAIDNQNLFLVDPSFPQPVVITKLSPEFIPPIISLDTFLISPSKNYLVWYTPQQGIVKLNLITKSISTIWPVSSWLNHNPYIVFSPNKDELHFIDSEGTKFVTVDVSTDQSRSMAIPYPFGNLFFISPNHQHLIFVSGFGQTKTYPQYMFTDLDGTHPYRFTPKIDINLRHLVVWLPDSSGVVLVKDHHHLVVALLSKPNTLIPYYDLEDTKDITNLKSLDDSLFIETNHNRWDVLDLNSKALAASIPIEIAGELHQPIFIPWFDNHILIEETLKLNQQRFSRLWISNFQGIKKNILDKYNQTTLEDQTPAL